MRLARAVPYVALPMNTEATMNPTNTIESTSTDFTAPGPGSWQQDPAHWPRAVTPWTADTFPRGFVRGFAESTRRYGVLVSHLEAAVVSGYVYYRTVPAAEAEVPERIDTARAAFESRRWRDDLELWDAELKPDSIRRNRRLQEVDLAQLDDAALARHLVACSDNQEEMVYRHHKFNMAAMLPVGNFVAHVTRWTGASNAEVLDLLRGSTPVSLGIAERELRAVGAALHTADVGPESFPATRSAASILESLRTRTDAVGEAVRAFLETAGSHLAGGYDVNYKTTGEMPELVLETFWQALSGTGPRDDAERGRLSDIRPRVPEAHRSEFDALLAEARLVSRLRDERGLFNDLWAAGISRLALIETGRRLVLRGRLDDESLVLEAELHEIVALLDGADAPTSRELAERGHRRASVRLEDVPPILGDAPMPPPPVDGLPPDARMAAIAIGVVIDEILGNATATNDARVVRGKGASPGVYEGRARIVRGPEDFHRVVRGDVLVMTSTSASVNVLLPVIGAIVTDRGGLLSHAAIVAREYGIPGVVGTFDATKIIADGAIVRVDGSNATVEVLR